MFKTLMTCTICGIYLSSCATATRGTKTKMIIDTEPPGAMVLTDKELPSSKRARKKNPDLEPEYYGCPATPCEIKMSRRSEFIMTISHDGYEDVEIGVDNGIHKESLNADLAGSTGLGVGLGLGVGAIAGGLSGGGIAAGAATAAAGVVTGGALIISVGVDVATGAILNLRPNPIVLTLPPEGTEFEPHPRVKEIQDRRAKRKKS